MQWFVPSNAGNISTATKRWNYSGNPTSYSINTTPTMILQPTNSVRAISYSATASSGTIIKIWLNADPATEPAQLRSCDGHNMVDFVYSGTMSVACDVGSATIVIDTAVEQI